jgi:mannonate dehydratase
MIQIAEVLRPEPSPLWRLVQQCGIKHVVAAMDLRGRADAAKDAQPWSYMSLLRAKQVYNDHGFSLDVIESRPPLNKAKLGLPGGQEETDIACELIQNMGRLGIPVWCYEWMPVGVLRTSKAAPARGGALATGYDHQLMANAPLTEYGEVSAERLWENLHRFLERVVPVAEAAKVKLAMHPDDPPLSPIRGVARIMARVEDFQRLIDLVPSPANGITLCQGNFTLMTPDLPAVIRQFGKHGKIFFVHFRDVRGRPEKFVETFHDEGQTDMAACMRAYKDIGYDGVCRPDHVPTMEGDSNENPMYSSIGRLFAIGYLKGLREAVYGRARA